MVLPWRVVPCTFVAMLCVISSQRRRPQPRWPQFKNILPLASPPCATLGVERACREAVRCALPIRKLPQGRTAPFDRPHSAQGIGSCCRGAQSRFLSQARIKASRTTPTLHRAAGDASFANALTPSRHSPDSWPGALDQRRRPEGERWHRKLVLLRAYPRVCHRCCNVCKRAQTWVSACLAIAAHTKAFTQPADVLYKVCLTRLPTLCKMREHQRARVRSVGGPEVLAGPMDYRTLPRAPTPASACSRGRAPTEAVGAAEGRDNRRAPHEAITLGRTWGRSTRSHLRHWMPFPLPKSTKSAVARLLLSPLSGCCRQ